jgi:hypothetical protein
MDQETTEPEPQGAQEYMDANEQVSVFGVEMRVDTRKVERDIQGLLVIDIEPGSPGAAAGLHPFRERTRDVLNGVGMLAAMVFPPAIVVVPIVESVPLHESYDLIIGGFRTQFSFPPSSRVTEIRSALRVVYPAGDGSAAILRSMLPKSRRVRQGQRSHPPLRNPQHQHSAHPCPTSLSI